MQPGTTFGVYEILSKLGAGGPANARLKTGELRRGLAEAQRSSL